MMNLWAKPKTNPLLECRERVVEDWPRMQLCDRQLAANVPLNTPGQFL